MPPKHPWTLDRDTLWPEVQRYLRPDDEGTLRALLDRSLNPQNAVRIIYMGMVRAYSAGYAKRQMEAEEAARN